MDKSGMGSGVGVVVRLLVLSLVVGVVLTALDITPTNLVSKVTLLARHLYELGFASFHWVAQYILVGAMVVVPIWLVARLLRAVQPPKS